MNVRDVTERQQAELALLNEKNKLDAVIRAMTSGVTIRDRDYRLIFQSPLTTAIFGSRIGEKCHQVFQQRDTICEKCPVELSFQDGNSHTLIVEVRNFKDAEVPSMESSSFKSRAIKEVIGLML